MKQIDFIRETEIKKELGDVLYVINWSGLSRNYFVKSTAWLYHKLDGVDEKGNPCEFTKEEILHLRNTFMDLANKLNTLAETLIINK